MTIYKNTRLCGVFSESRRLESTDVLASRIARPQVQGMGVGARRPKAETVRLRLRRISHHHVLVHGAVGLDTRDVVPDIHRLPEVKEHAVPDGGPNVLFR